MSMSSQASGAPPKSSGQGSSWAIVTGASAGLGTEYARQIARSEGDVRFLLVARRKDRLEALGRELGGRAYDVMAGDLGDAAFVQSIVQKVADSKMSVRWLVNNAGFGAYGSFHKQELSTINQMIAVNVSALVALTHGLLPFMDRSRQSYILNVSSSISFAPLNGFSVYPATKAFVQSFTLALRGEMRGSKREGLRPHVLAVCPGPVLTEFGEVAQRLGRVSAPAMPPAIICEDAKDTVSRSLRAARRGWPFVPTGAVAWLFLVTSKLLPHSWIATRRA